MRRVVLVLGVLVGIGGCDQAERAEQVEQLADPLAVALAGSAGAEGAIAELRGRGREGFAELLAAYRAPERAGDPRDWQRVLDRVAGQRDAATSGLYWEMDLERALTQARVRGVPVLSLRMLGDLRETLSCANSRFFRALLYSDADLAAFLDENFVLHWSSERPVPTVTIDFGDGRSITTTTTGNSAHYVLDHDGRVLDVLPGLYDPRAFESRLAEGLGVHEAIVRSPERRDAILREHHRHAAQAIETRMAPWTAADPSLAAWMRRPPGGTGADSVPARTAQPIATSKMRVETPVLRGIEELDAPPPGDPSPATLRDMAAPVALSDNALAILQRDRPQRADETTPAHAERLDALVRKTADDLALDALVNEIRLHYQIHRWFAAGEIDGDFATVNERVYRELFATPRTDPWLGLRDDASYDGLPEGPHRAAG